MRDFGAFSLERDVVMRTPTPRKGDICGRGGRETVNARALRKQGLLGTAELIYELTRTVAAYTRPV